MTQAKRRKVITYSMATYDSVDQRPYNDAQLENRNLRIRELNEEYKQQTMHLKRISQKARQNFMGFSEPKNTREIR